MTVAPQVVLKDAKIFDVNLHSGPAILGFEERKKAVRGLGRWTAIHIAPATKVAS